MQLRKILITIILFAFSTGNFAQYKSQYFEIDCEFYSEDEGVVETLDGYKWMKGGDSTVVNLSKIWVSYEYRIGEGGRVILDTIQQFNFDSGMIEGRIIRSDSLLIYHFTFDFEVTKYAVKDTIRTKLMKKCSLSQYLGKESLQEGRFTLRKVVESVDTVDLSLDFEMQKGLIYITNFDFTGGYVLGWLDSIPIKKGEYKEFKVEQFVENMKVKGYRLEHNQFGGVVFEGRGSCFDLGESDNSRTIHNVILFFLDERNQSFYCTVELNKPMLVDEKEVLDFNQYKNKTINRVDYRSRIRRNSWPPLFVK